MSQNQNENIKISLIYFMSSLNHSFICLSDFHFINKIFNENDLNVLIIISDVSASEFPALKCISVIVINCIWINCEFQLSNSLVTSSGQSVTCEIFHKYLHIAFIRSFVYFTRPLTSVKTYRIYMKNTFHRTHSTLVNAGCFFFFFLVQFYS